MENYMEEIQKYLDDEMEVLKRLDLNEINDAINLLEQARLQNRTVFICGNGGSASTASHFASDFNKGVSLALEKKTNFICLSDNVPMMTAIANDIGYDRIFDIPLQNRMKEGDILIAISGSGNSPNVVRAAEYAKKHGNRVIGITGYSGGRLKEIADTKLHVPIDNMQIAEDVHLIFNHLMMFILSNRRAEGDVDPCLCC